MHARKNYRKATAFVDAAVRLKKQSVHAAKRRTDDFHDERPDFLKIDFMLLLF